MPERLLKTPPPDRHVALRARMVRFAAGVGRVQCEGNIPEHRVSGPACLSAAGCALLPVRGLRETEPLDLTGAKQFAFDEGAIDGIQCIVNRTGSAGEAGCAILVLAEDAAALWDGVLERGAVTCGLGARDT